MGIERITSSIIAQANEEANERINSAKKLASNNIAEAGLIRDKLLKSVRESFESYQAEHEKERFAWARLESKRIIAEAKEDVIKNAFESMFSDFSDLRKSSEYKNFIKASVNSCIKELGSESVIIHCLKGEKSLIVVSAKAKILEDLDGLGGCIVELSDKSVRIDLTLEALFENKREQIRKDLYSKFFSGEKKKDK